MNFSFFTVNNFYLEICNIIYEFIDELFCGREHKIHGSSSRKNVSKRGTNLKAM